MDRRDAAIYAVSLLLMVTGAAMALDSGLVYRLTDASPSDYEKATVTLKDANGTRLGTVRARVADTERKRYVGLSKTDALEAGEGMLFVYDGEGQRAYVMRNMSFALDIVFVAANGTVTEIHHAPVPPPGTSGSDLRRYSGRAKYVLEVPRGYANRTGLDEGDRVRIPDSP